MFFLRFIDKNIKIFTLNGSYQGKFVQEHKDFIEIQYQGAERFISKSAIVEIHFLKANESIGEIPSF